MEDMELKLLKMEIDSLKEKLNLLYDDDLK